MNITRENIDELNAVLSVKLEKNDYEERVNKTLKDYRKKARIDGFRPGMVPFGLINKMYRKPVLIEEVNKLVSESVSKFQLEEKLNILGDPIPHEVDENKIDWDNDTEFEFKFDLGMAPDTEIKITGKDKIPFYNIKTDNKLIDKYVENYCQRLGEMISVDKASDKDLIKASLVELDDTGAPKENGISVDEATLSIEVIKDESVKKSFIGIKKGDTQNIDIRKAYPSDAELSGLLKIDKARLEDISNNFSVTIKEISQFKNAEVNQKMFDKIYGEGNVKSEKEFRERIAEDAKPALSQESDYRFSLDVKDILVKKFKNKLPSEFLKRWLFLINKGEYTKEQIENDYDHFEEDLKWQLIKDQIIKENQLVVTDEDLEKGAKEVARAQFRQYGMNNVPDEHLAEFSKKILENTEEKNKIRTRAAEEKVIAFLKDTVKIDEKEINIDKFNKLFEDKKSRK
ncbi:MAG: trigger factor [Bacteroidales bacterium]|nr:trigger factor [Bacteroidales bacterium]